MLGDPVCRRAEQVVAQEMPSVADDDEVRTRFLRDGDDELGRVARSATELGLDGLELFERMKDDLAKVYLLMGETHSSQTHELLDEVLRAQHAFQKSG